MRHFFLKLIRRRRLHRDLESELAFHRELAAAQGNPIPLGSAAAIKEQALDLWRFNRIENLWRDVGYAARTLRRSPGLVLSALLSLGLGIGVNTAMFSITVEFCLASPPSRTPNRWLPFVWGATATRIPRWWSSCVKAMCSRKWPERTRRPTSTGMTAARHVPSLPCKPARITSRPWAYLWLSVADGWRATPMRSPSWATSSGASSCT